jgi:hypothetical protein
MKKAFNLGVALIVGVTLTTLMMLSLGGVPVQAAPLLTTTPAVLTVTTISWAGGGAVTETTYPISYTAGNRFTNDGRIMLQLVNNYTATVTAIFETPGHNSIGLEIADLDVVVPAGVTKFVPFLPPGDFNQTISGTLNQVKITYTTADTVSLGNNFTIGLWRFQ